LDEQLQEDLRRLQEKTRVYGGKADARLNGGAAEAGSQWSLKETVDKVLIADFFFILFALGWLALGVGIKSTSGSTVRVFVVCGILAAVA